MFLFLVPHFVLGCYLNIHLDKNKNENKTVAIYQT